MKGITAETRAKGRPKGAKNKRTLFKLAMQLGVVKLTPLEQRIPHLLTDEYFASLYRRMLNGRGGQEALYVMEMAYGRPRQQVEIQGNITVTVESSAFEEKLAALAGRIPAEVVESLPPLRALSAVPPPEPPQPPEEPTE